MVRGRGDTGDVHDGEVGGKRVKAKISVQRQTPKYRHEI